MESLKKYVPKLPQDFPDLLETIEDIIAEGDEVWVRFKVTGTHTGVYRGLAPTDKKVTFRAVSIYRIVDGKVVEREAVYDLMDSYRQLGVIEYKGFPDEIT
jgi:predicted ester cyclase